MAESDSTTGLAQERAGLRFFDVNDAEWISLLDEQKSPAESLVGRDKDYLSKIRRAQLLTEPADQLSVIGVAFEPDFRIATHYHDIDQFLLIIKGEFRMGRRRLHPGHCAYMPAGNPYGAQVGRAGGVFLEFRSAPFYRTAFLGNDSTHVGGAPPRSIEGWKKPEPKKGVTTFVDVETHPLVEATGFGPGDRTAIAASLQGALRYQMLHGGPGYSLHSVIASGALQVPLHRQDADKVIYVLAGELTLVNQNGMALRPGTGVHVPAGRDVQIAIGAAGARYLEFRDTPFWRTTWAAN